MSPIAASAAKGLVRTFHEAGVLSVADVQVAQHTLFLAGEADETVGLAAALAVRALRAGKVAADLAGAAAAEYTLDELRLDTAALPWPALNIWLDAVRVSPAVTDGTDPSTVRPLRLVGDRLYLERYWRDEQAVWRALTQRLEATATLVADPALVRGKLAAAFPHPDEADARSAVAQALASRLVVVTGGPGTGKTSLVARLLALLIDLEGAELRVGLAAPTAKAAARLTDSIRGARLDPQVFGERARDRVRQAQAVTVHRLLGPLPETRTRFRHTADNPLPHDVVVVDEMSMVSLTLMSRLLAAVRPSARLVLVGDPEQLTSIDAGTVLADIVTTDLALPEPTRVSVRELAGRDADGPTVTLRHTWRFTGGIQRLAAAVVGGEAAAALAELETGTEVRLLNEAEGRLAARESSIAWGRALYAPALAGDAEAALSALGDHRLLCAHRHGPWGVSHWQAQIERWLRQELPGYADSGGDWFVGRPLLATATIPDLALLNGDSGVVVRDGDTVRAAFERAGEPLVLSPYVLEGVQSLFAMTIHKSQGSQFRHVTVVLPGEESPLLTRELLYTAVTRATHTVTLIGSAAAVRRAIERPRT